MKNNYSRKLAFIGFTANVLEWYDFSIYAYVSDIMSQVFFPATNHQLALVKTFLIFSISYLIRPLGGIFIGYVGHQQGRGKALNISLILMAFSTFLIGLLPGFSTLGWLSIIGLILLRCMQGFAAGGELPVSICFLYENAPANKKTFFSSIAAASSMLGVCLGSFIVFMLNLLFTHNQLLEWAWRMPFVFSGIFAIVIYKLRKDITTIPLAAPSLTEHSTSKSRISFMDSARTALSKLYKHKQAIIKVIALNGFVSTSFYLLFVWMPSYLSVFLNVSKVVAYLSSTGSLFFLIMLTILLTLYVADSKRKKWLKAGIMLIVLLSYPLFYLINIKISYLILFAQFTFAFGLALIDCVINAYVCDLFDDDIRCIALSTSLALSTAIFGGLAPTICSYLIYKTNNFYSPAFLVISTGVMAFIMLTTNRVESFSRVIIDGRTE